MKPWEVRVGEVRRVLREMQAESFDACLSDPPYGLKFMGRRWDYSVPSVNVWVELLRVLRPGAYALLFGGPKTFHRLMVGVEDAGFIPCDTLSWMYATGFPKSLDISKAIDRKNGHWRGRAGPAADTDSMRSMGQHYACNPKGEPVTAAAAARWNGYGTGLKPGWEPIMLACKWAEGTYVDTVLTQQTGALAIDACRIGSDEPFVAPAGNDGTSPASFAPVNVTGYTGRTVVGRWPANVLLSHSDACVQKGTRKVRTNTARRASGGRNIHSEKKKPPLADLGYGDANGQEEIEAWECVADCPVRMLDRQSGDRPGMSGGGQHRNGYAGGMFGAIDSAHTARADSGGASRFFFTTKASRSERERGLEGTAISKRAGVGALRDGGRARSEVLNDHPTLKPIALTRYLARLLLPPPREDGRPRRIVVPFCGSGSEMIGCLQAGWDEVVGIEIDPKHADKARHRIQNGRIIQHAGA